MPEVALTVLVAILLIVAAEGRHPYGFSMGAEDGCNGGRGLLGAQGVPRGATGVDVGFPGRRAPAQPDPSGTDAVVAVAAD